jgi:hypothetical protein
VCDVAPAIHLQGLRALVAVLHPHHRHVGVTIEREDFDHFLDHTIGSASDDVARSAPVPWIVDGFDGVSGKGEVSQFAALAQQGFAGLVAGQGTTIPEQLRVQPAVEIDSQIAARDPHLAAFRTGPCRGAAG